MTKRAATAWIIGMVVVTIVVVVALSQWASNGAESVNSLSGGTQPTFVRNPPARRAPCPLGQVLVGDGYAPSVCHRFDTLPTEEKAQAGNFPCPASATVEIIHVGSWVVRCVQG